MGQLVKFPMFQTYTQKGLTKDQIKSDATMTIINRGLRMSNSERLALGVSEDFWTAENVLGLWDNGRIRFDYDPRSIGDPTYRISMDLDGDGLFMALNNPTDPDISFKPEANRTLNGSLTLEGVRAEFQNEAWENWMNTFPTESFTQKYMFDPVSEVPFVMSTLKGMFNLMYNGYNKGKNGVEDVARMFNDIDWLPDVEFDMNTVERQLQENQINFLTYQQQKEEGIFDETISGKFEGSEQTALGFEDTGTSILFSTINDQEGGFRSYAYDSGYTADRNKTFIPGVRGVGGGPIEMAAKDSKIHKAEYDLMMSEIGDPTIGTGLSLKDPTVIKELQNLGYNIDKLLTGEQSLTRKDNNIVMMKMIDQKLNIVSDLVGIPVNELATNKNAYLTIGLIKLAYNSSSWIGPRFQKALKMYIETGDEKWLGTFSSYNSGSNEFYSEDRPKILGGPNRKEIEQYEPTLLNELWNDAESMNANGMGGFLTMMEDVGGFITAWSQGQMTYFPELQIAASPQISKKNKSVLD